MGSEELKPVENLENLGLMRVIPLSLTDKEFLRAMRNIAGSTKALAEMYSLLFPNKKACLQTIGNKIREGRGFSEEEANVFVYGLRKRKEFSGFIKELTTTYMAITTLLQMNVIRITGVSQELREYPLTEEERKYWDDIYTKAGALDDVEEFPKREEEEEEKEEEEIIREEIMEEVKETKKMDVDDILLRMLALNEEPQEEEPQEKKPQEKKPQEEEPQEEEPQEEEPQEKKPQEEEPQEEEPQEEEPQEEEEKDYIDAFVENRTVSTGEDNGPGIIHTASNDPFDSKLASIPDVFDAQERRF